MSDDSANLPAENDAGGASAAQRSGKRNGPLLKSRKVILMRTSDIESGGFADWVHKAVVALSHRRKYGLGRIFQVGGSLARIRPKAPGIDARIEMLTEESLRVCLSRLWPLRPSAWQTVSETAAVSYVVVPAPRRPGPWRLGNTRRSWGNADPQDSRRRIAIGADDLNPIL